MRTLAAALILLAPAAMAADAERGEALAERWCSTCHVTSADMGGDAGPAFETLMKDGQRDVPGLRAWLFEPHPPMPDLNLTSEEIDDLIAYIKSIQR